jgi:hypothetical protein
MCVDNGRSAPHRSAIIRPAASLLSGGNRASIFCDTAGVSGVMMPNVHSEGRAALLRAFLSTVLLAVVS